MEVTETRGDALRYTSVSLNCVLSLRVGVNVGPMVCSQGLCSSFVFCFALFWLQGLKPLEPIIEVLIEEIFFLLFSASQVQNNDSLFSFVGTPVSRILLSFQIALCLFQVLLFKCVVIYYILQNFFYVAIYLFKHGRAIAHLLPPTIPKSGIL